MPNKILTILMLISSFVANANDVKESNSYSILDPEIKYPIRVIEWTPDGNSNMRCSYVIGVGNSNFFCYKADNEMPRKQQRNAGQTK